MAALFVSTGNIYLEAVGVYLFNKNPHTVKNNSNVCIIQIIFLIWFYTRGII